MESELFPDLKGQRLLLRCVGLRESLVEGLLDQAMQIFNGNTAGPQKYLNTYRKYADLLNGKADDDTRAFLGEAHSLEAFQQVSLVC